MSALGFESLFNLPNGAKREAGLKLRAHATARVMPWRHTAQAAPVPHQEWGYCRPSQAQLEAPSRQPEPAAQ